MCTPQYYTKMVNIRFIEKYDYPCIKLYTKNRSEDDGRPSRRRPPPGTQRQTPDATGKSTRGDTHLGFIRVSHPSSGTSSVFTLWYSTLTPVDPPVTGLDSYDLETQDPFRVWS